MYKKINRSVTGRNTAGQMYLYYAILKWLFMLAWQISNYKQTSNHSGPLRNHEAHNDKCLVATNQNTKATT